ncbi:MAG TPA: peptidyl-tRNA hydrolase, partial [Pirellulales bacterium]
MPRSSAIMLKMYIIVRESVPKGFAVLDAAHASLACYLKFRESEEIQSWLAGPFYKVVCKVTDSEFESAKALEGSVVLTES